MFLAPLNFNLYRVRVMQECRRLMKLQGNFRIKISISYKMLHLHLQQYSTQDSTIHPNPYIPLSNFKAQENGGSIVMHAPHWNLSIWANFLFRQPKIKKFTTRPSTTQLRNMRKFSTNRISRWSISNRIH